MDLDALVSAVKEQFDVADARVTQWINDRHKQMVAQAGWRTVEAQIAPTVAGQDTYQLDPTLIDVVALRVGDVTYAPASQQQVWDLQDASSGAYLDGPGVYAPCYDADGNPAVQIYPPPSDSGVALMALMTYVPDDLSSGQSPIVPVDFHRYLLAGVIADAYRQLLARHDLADPHEQQYADGVERLRRRKLARVGNGASQAQIQGYHFL